MPDIEILSPTTWDGKSWGYSPEGASSSARSRARRQFRAFSRVSEPKNVGVTKATLRADHGHVLSALPPKYSVAHVVGLLKGKAASRMARTFMGRRKHSAGHHCWARGDDGSTVGRDQETSRESIRTQEAEERRFDHMDLWEAGPPGGGSQTYRFERFSVSLRFERFHLFQASGFAGGDDFSRVPKWPAQLPNLAYARGGSSEDEFYVLVTGPCRTTAGSG